MRARAPVVIRNEYEAAFGGEPSNGSDLLLEVEALRAEATGADPDLDLLAELDGRTEVDFRAGEDEALERILRAETE